MTYPRMALRFAAPTVLVALSDGDPRGAQLVAALSRRLALPEDQVLDGIYALAGI